MEKPGYRNRQLMKDYLETSLSVGALAKKYEISKGRISQLIAEIAERNNPVAWGDLNKKKLDLSTYPQSRREIMTRHKHLFLGVDAHFETENQRQQAANLPLGDVLNQTALPQRITSHLVKSRYATLQDLLNTSAENLVGINYVGLSDALVLEGCLKDLGFKPKWDFSHLSAKVKIVTKAVTCPKCDSENVVGKNICVGRVRNKKVVFTDLQCQDVDCHHIEHGMMLEDIRKQ